MRLPSVKDSATDPCTSRGNNKNQPAPKSTTTTTTTVTTTTTTIATIATCTTLGEGLTTGEAEFSDSMATRPWPTDCVNQQFVNANELEWNGTKRIVVEYNQVECYGRKVSS
ncbi:hypothetical protein AWZ03_012582 [Drosophila navojoa]|uniref:Uncharacterized protein n=1 Tax=Drosophila navojoa TaxID=7232 RepID=A0A484AWG7_DRONA|nr:hypothetical protein AWZ03_012582 [Drosophila navojoa]